MPTPSRLPSGALAYPISQPGQYGVPGPYVNGSNWYYFASEVASFSSAPTIEIYKSTNQGTTWSRNTSGPAVFGQGFPSVFWPGSGSVVYMSYMDTGSSPRALKVITFDMATETLSSAINTGHSVASGNINSLFFLKQPSGLWVVLYDVPASTGGIFALTSSDSGTTWSSPVTVVASSANLPLLENPVIDGAGNIGINYSTWTSGYGRRAVEYYCIFNGISVTSTVTALADASHISIANSILQNPGIYNALRDAVIFPIGEFVNPNSFIELLVGTPSAAPIFTKVSVWNDGGANDAPWFPTIGQSPDGTKIDVIWANDLGSFPFESILQQSNATDLPLATWTTPTTIYDETLNPPTPTPRFGELFPVFQNVLADGTLVVVTGMNQEVAPGENWCGVLYSFTFPSVPSPLTPACPIGGGTATVGVPYTAMLLASGGTPPYTWSLVG